MLDIRTMYFLLVMSSILAGFCVFAMNMPNKERRRSAIRWGAGNFMVAAGLLLVGLRGIIPLWPSAVLGNSVLCGGFALLYLSFCMLMQKPQKEHHYLVAVIAYSILFQLLVAFDVAVRHRIVLFSLMLIAVSIGIINAAGTSQNPHTKNARLLMQGFYIIVLVNALSRGLYAEFFTDNATSIFEPTAVQVLSFISYYFALIGAGIAYLLMQSGLAYNDLAAITNNDLLTGVRNRRNFMEMAERDWALAQRMWRPLSVMVLDLDNFKKINDDFGHQVGDESLRRFGTILNNSVRNVDLVGKYLGEEFCIVMTDTSPDIARHSAERIRRDFEAVEFFVEGRRVPLSVSIGISGMAAGDTRSMQQLLRAADNALYAAKHAGRNCIRQEAAHLLDTAGAPLK
ncbi:MAG: GGDEF domain-containing protein [bacterium]|nr:GGDEF domain-containing protein [bacterium]